MKKQITIRSLQLHQMQHDYGCTQIHKMTEELLASDWTKNKFSFEDCYRLLYNFQQNHPSSDVFLKEVAFLYESFVDGAWHSRSNWEGLRDCWLYPIRVNPMGNFAQLTFDHILSTINCYPVLLSYIFQQHNIPADIQRLITKLVIPRI